MCNKVGYSTILSAVMLFLIEHCQCLCNIFSFGQELLALYVLLIKYITLIFIEEMKISL